MKITYTYYRNPSTGEVVMRQCFTTTYESWDAPAVPQVAEDVYFYNSEEKSIPPPDITGWQEISKEEFYDIAYASRNL